MRYEGKRLVVVGGSSGLGLATAKLAVAEGGSVTIAGRSGHRLARAAAEFDPSRVRTVVADIADEGAINALFEDEIQVDSIFVTAGELVPGGADLLTTELDRLRSVLETRIMGVAHVVRASRAKLAPDGSIVLMSGLFAVRPLAGGALGGGAVAAVEGMTRALALDLAPIRVNAVAPGYIDTPLFDSFGEDWPRIATEVGRKLPVGRIGRPEEVAEAVLLLMTNGFITGTVLRIDGGGSLV